jgi:hypothetical protein
MAINWFEGGRRITNLVQGLLLLGCASYIVFSSPYEELTLETRYPDQPFAISSAACGYDADARHDLYDFKVGSKNINILLCFRATETNEGKLAIAYAAANTPGSFWMGDEYSEDVRTYIHKRASEFSVTPKILAESEAALDERWWREKKQYFKDAFQFGAIGWILLWIFSTVVGWIIRGFAGIPSNLDFREG